MPPGRGSAAGQFFFGSTLLQPAHSACISSELFFTSSIFLIIIHCNFAITWLLVLSSRYIYTTLDTHATQKGVLLPVMKEYATQNALQNCDHTAKVQPPEQWTQQPPRSSTANRIYPKINNNKHISKILNHGSIIIIGSLINLFFYLNICLNTIITKKIKKQ